MAFWNLHALAHGLLPLMPDPQEDAIATMKDAMEPFKAEFASAMLARFRAKLGLTTAQDGDDTLADDLLRLMAQDRADHTITWRALGRFSTAEGAANTPLRDQFIDRAAFDAWAQRYRGRLQAEASVDAERQARMDRVNPKFVLRNHLAETAIEAARQGDFSETQRLLHVLQAPYDEHPDAPAAYAALPPDWAHHLEVSCSS